jgi:hypothetical protein
MAIVSFGSGLIQHNQPLAMTTFVAQDGEAILHTDRDTTFALRQGKAGPPGNQSGRPNRETTVLAT